MKIGDSPKTAAASRLQRNRGVGAAPPSSTNSAAPADQIVLAGVPEAELTPRVREALVSLMQEVQSLREQIAWSQERIEDLERLADSDPMLDIFNRRAFVRELDRALGLIDRYSMKASLVFVDLNDLKKINDKMGHGAGDAALTHVANVLSANVRQSDAVGRLGGDEFGVLLTQADQPTAELKAAQLTSAVAANPVAWKDGSFTAHVSCGVVEIAKGLSADEAMERADNAMYEVKSRKNGG
ncbi:GGDEF domain-containing protein [Hyphococcus sp.]|uniref:GGDEF domain-containing protein n=1 Tax=Hyphococcus sp. TaxID=2038636 RepID=UPI00208D6707|nr:MAG: GGDEF domain-containing protein [Marinicaulis sp.]